MMFNPDDCPSLVAIQRSLPNHKEDLYKELARVEPGYRRFLQALLSKAEEQLGKEEEENELGHQRKMMKSDVHKLNRHMSQVRPRSDVNGSMHIRAVRTTGNGRGKELLKKKPDTDVLRLNHKQAMSSKKSNAESSRVSKAILVDIEDSFEPEHDRTICLGKRVDPVHSGLRNVVDRRNVDKGKSVIQVEDLVHENTNMRPNPKNRVELIDKAPYVMDEAHVTRKLREAVKGKNVVRGDQMDQGRSSHKGKSVIQVEDLVHENTNRRPNPKNQVERIHKAPYVMDEAHVIGKLREAVKGKNVVRGDQMDQGRSSHKGKSVIQVEDLVHENTNRRSNPKNQVERIDKAPYVMDEAHVTRKLREAVKGKNVVRGDQMDQGRSSQKLGPGNNSLPKKLSEHVEKGKTQSEKGLKRPAASTYAVTENHYERGDSAQRLKEREVQSLKKLKKVVIEERESPVEIIASSPPRSARRQLGNNLQLRNVKFGESSRPKKKICKNNQA